MGSMVDTQVLIYAYSMSHKPTTTREKEFLKKNLARCQASSALLARLKTIYASSVSIVEFRRTSNKSQIVWLDSFGPRLVPLPLDIRAAERAAKLLLTRPESIDVCPKCMNHADGHECGECKKFISKYHRVADAMIAATAEEDKDVDVLYCYDTGVLDLGKLLKTCVVRTPPDIYEGTLFALIRAPESAPHVEQEPQRAAPATKTRKDNSKTSRPSAEESPDAIDNPAPSHALGSRPPTLPPTA